MAVQFFIGRVLSASLAVSLVLALAVYFDAAAPAEAGHFLTHPVGTPAAPSAPSLAAQAGRLRTHPAGTPAAPSAPSVAAPAAAQADARSATQNTAQIRAQNGTGTSSSAVTLFKKGADINVKKDANVYLTPRNIPEHDRLLGAYNADQPNGGRAQTRAGDAAAVPGLLGIANQAHRARDPDGQNNQGYSLADAMRDAIWRKNTAARLKSLTTSLTACAEGAAKKSPVIGLVPSC